MLDTKSKYSKSGISTQESSIIFEALKLKIELTEAYLDHEISLPKLADSMSFSTNIISQAINESGGVNFFDFINQYRVERAKLLLETTTLPLSSLPYSAGFKSKTTFYSTFKRFCQCSPGEYRQKVRQPTQKGLV